MITLSTLMLTRDNALHSPDVESGPLVPVLSLTQSSSTLKTHIHDRGGLALFSDVFSASF